MLLLLLLLLVFGVLESQAQFEEETKEYMGLYIGDLNSYHHQVSATSPKGVK